MMKKVIIALLAITMVGADAMGKKKDIVILEEKVAHLNQKVDSLENVILKQRADVSEKITNLFQAYNDLRTSYDKLAQDMKNNQMAASIEIEGDLSCGLALAKSGVLYGYVNAKGEMVIEPIYESAYYFTDNYAEVQKDGKWGVIDTAGNIVIPCQYEKINRYESTKILYKVCESNSLWGLVAPEGVIYECLYTNIDKFGESDNLLRIEKDGQKGIADISGKIIIPCKYVRISSYNKSLNIYEVRNSQGLDGLITPTKTVQPCVYLNIGSLNNGRCSFKKNGLHGYFDEKGEIAIPAKYPSILGAFKNDGTAEVCLGGQRWIVIDKWGKFLRNCD